MTRRICLALAIAVALAVAAPATAQEAPEEIVAQVGDRPIAKAEFDEWLEHALASARSVGGPLDPPDFERCIAAQRRRARQNGRHPTRPALRARCRGRYPATRRQVMFFLIQATWVHSDAAALGIAVSPRRVRWAFESQKREAFPKERDYRRFLRESGADEEDILYRVELDLLQSRLAQHAMSKAKAPTRRQVTSYVKRHPRLLGGLSRGEARYRARRQMLRSRRAEALVAFIEDFRARNKAATVCAPGYVIADCGDVLPVQARK